MSTVAMVGGRLLGGGAAGVEGTGTGARGGRGAKDCGKREPHARVVTHWSHLNLSLCV